MKVTMQNISDRLLCDSNARAEYEYSHYKATIWYYRPFYRASVTRQGCFFGLYLEPSLEQLIQTIQYEVTREEV